VSSGSWPRADRVPLGHYELSTQLLARELLRRGYRPRWRNRSFLTVVLGEELVGFWCTRSNANAAVAVKAAVRKDMTRALLREAGVPVAPGRLVRDREGAAAAAARIGYPVVVKPVAGKKGKGITVGVRDPEELARAWEVARGGRSRPRVLVEGMVHGDEARFLVVGGRVVAVLLRRPPSVTGDGVRTVRQLIDAKNAARHDNVHLASRPIELDDHRRDMIRAAGYDLDDVPAAGAWVLIDRKGGFSSGADSVDLTDHVHPSLRRVAEDAVAAMPGLGVAGVDVLAADFAAPAGEQDHVVVEVNSMPALGGHHFPWEGQARDVAAVIVDHHEARAGLAPAAAAAGHPAPPARQPARQPTRRPATIARALRRVRAGASAARRRAQRRTSE